MKKEQIEFLNLLRDYINDIKGEYYFENWDIVAEYARKHQVEAIMYIQTKNPLFRSSFAIQLFCSTERSYRINELKSILKGIDYIILKGEEIAKFYPNPELRTMGDIDVLIKEKDRNYVDIKLKQENYIFLGSWKKEWKYRKGSLLLEVHTDMIHYSTGKEKAERYFTNVWNYYYDEKLDWNFHFLFLIQHLKEHFVGAEVGFRQFMDIAIITKSSYGESYNILDLDWKWIENQLKEVDLLGFAQTVFAFNERWFDVDSPFVTQSISEDFFEEASSKIFEDGIYGCSISENDREISRRMYYEKLSVGKAKWKYRLEEIFPKFEEICKVPYCSYVKNNKVLLPIAWIHRIFYNLFSIKSIPISKKPLHHSNEKAEEQNAFLYKWGL